MSKKRKEQLQYTINVKVR